MITEPESSADRYPLGRELTATLREIAASYRDGEGGCHGPDHTERVHRTALHIGRLMGADLTILSAAALLHDIGRRYEMAEKGRICHAEKGAELAAEILVSLDFPTAMIDAIVHCIETHRYRGQKIPKTLEARILFDADKLDSIGAIGIGRAFLFAGQVGAKLHNGEADILASRSYTTEDTAYREFRVKMSKVRDRLLTPEGQRLARERHAFMEVFFDRLDREVNGATSVAQSAVAGDGYPPLAASDHKRG
ncbi:MAG: phosphohydrolase [Deltaproteobacteria bacterium RIFOXYD12_FULL_57_12]|nr:MAG: phosphohydrolase [Deltaproteobacteria bacterium RIFOXYD12_FULL_57_12]